MGSLRRFSIRAIVALGFSAAFIMFCMAVYAWDRIPQEIIVPVHWSVNGPQNGYGLKPLALLGLPALTWVVTLLYCLRVRRGTNLENLNSAAPFLYATWLSVLLLMVAAQAMIVLTALGQMLPVTTIILLGTGLVLFVAGLGVYRHPDVGAGGRLYLRDGELELNKICGVAVLAMGFCIIPTALTGNIAASLTVILTGVLFTFALRVWAALNGRKKKA